MFRVCDIDALMTPGQAVYYVIKQIDQDAKETTPELVNDTIENIAHRVVDMIIVHDYFDPEFNLPVISYAVTEEIDYEPLGFIVLTVEEFMEALEYDTNCTIIKVNGTGTLVSGLSFKHDGDKIVVIIDTADQMVQYIPS